jgi:hypothetical protein
VSLQLLSALDKKHNGMMQVRQKRMHRRAAAKKAKRAGPLSNNSEGLTVDEGDDEAAVRR